jgi:hypothetical protein
MRRLIKLLAVAALALATVQAQSRAKGECDCCFTLWATIGWTAGSN